MSKAARSFDPYETLGVPRDATEADVRSAFRRKAKTAHPDAGGSAEEFTEINRAHVVLADPARREHFDRTGFVDDGVDNTDQVALQIIMGMISSIFIGEADILNCDLIAVMDRHLDKELLGDTGRMQAVERACRRAERAKARFTRKHKGGPNRIVKMIAVHAAAMKQQQEGIRRRIETLNRARAILKEYQFTPEQVERAFVFTTASTSSAT